MALSDEQLRHLINAREHISDANTFLEFANNPEIDEFVSKLRKDCEDMTQKIQTVIIVNK